MGRPDHRRGSAALNVDGMDAGLQAAWDRIPLPQETLAGITSAALAQQVWPLRLPAWTRPMGWLCAGGGLAMVIVAVRERGPGSLDESPTLVTRGLHGRSRNPMYVGYTALHLGLAVATRNAWMLASCLLSAGLLHRSVLRDERALRGRFGDEYDAYRSRVPRY
jgi:protein-S-isoprenylcysteine O-methyltransferase Ste14